MKSLYIKVIFSASFCLLFALYSTIPSIALEKKDWYEDNPTYTDTYDHYGDFTHSTPADENMSNARLSAGIEAVKNDYVFSFIILRNGKIVKEVYTNGSGREDSNNIHSSSKSMLPALVGIAIEDEYINSVNDEIKDYLTDWYPTNDSNKDDITIQHLMEMASGLNWTEDETEDYVDNYEDWQAKILERNLDTTPGTDFNYSTGVAHLISTVLGEAHPTLTLRKYAEVKLFDPLDITIEHWRTDPFGYQTGGCNLYLTPLEMAKFGQTYLNDGVWDSTQVIPSSMVNDSLNYKINIDSDYDYGYLWYIMDINGHDVYKAWGFGGQFIYLIPDLDIVFVTTANTAAGENDDGVEIDDVTFVKDFLIPSVYTGTPPAGSADNDLTFSDNFDDGNLNGWFIDGYEAFTINNWYNSPSYCARLAGTSEIIKTIDVTGESSVSLSCAVDTYNYDTQEKLFIETSQDGSNWTTEWSGSPVCENVGEFEEKSFTVDVSNGNTLYIKFRTNADGNSDEAYIDDITVTSSAPDPDPDPDPDPGVIDINNGQTVNNLSASKGNWLHYRINVPSGASNLNMVINGGSGDADLYTRFGSQPTSSSYDCRPYKNGNNETCSVENPQSGKYYVSLYGYSSFSNLALVASFENSDPDPDPDSSPDSCANACGGQAPGGCYCDSVCEQYGDCCSDKVEECGSD